MRTMWDFRFPWHWFGEFFFFLGSCTISQHKLWPTNPWRWRWCVPLKCQNMLKYLLHGMPHQKTRILKMCSTKNLKLTRKVKWTCNSDYCSNSLYLKLGLKLMLRTAIQIEFASSLSDVRLKDWASGFIRHWECCLKFMNIKMSVCIFYT